MTGHYREDRFADQVQPVSRERTENYDVIYRTDAAVMNYFTFWEIYHDTATNQLMEKMIPQVFATPRREFANMDVHTDNDERRTAMEWSAEGTPMQIESYAYPNIAVTRLDVTFDQTRFTYAHWRKLLYSNDLNMALEAPFPLPYNFSYQFDFWVLEQAQLNSIIEQWARKFPHPTWWLDIQYPFPWGTNTVHIQSQGVFSNTSLFEGGEVQRQLRGVATVNLFGWIPLPYTWTRTVQKITLELIEESSQEILEIYETEWADKPTFWETGDQEQVLVWK